MNTENINLNDLNNQTLAQLREIAKELNIKSVTKYKKAELIDKINENANKSSNSDSDELKQNNKKVQNIEDTAKKYNVKKEEKNTQIDDYNSANLENTKQPAFKSENNKMQSATLGPTPDNFNNSSLTSIVFGLFFIFSMSTCLFNIIFVVSYNLMSLNPNPNFLYSSTVTFFSCSGVGKV